MNKDITIYDIAKKTGLSPTTVSRALNNHPAVKEKTKSAVIETAEHLGYRSNIFATNLRRNRTNNIGVIVPKLNSPFQSTVLSGMENVAQKSGFNLIISQSFESIEREKSLSETMYNNRVDGLLVSLADHPQGIEHFRSFIKKGIPLMFFDRINGSEDVSGIIIDNVQAAYSATKHLLEQGCKNIIHVLGNTNISIYRERLNGYKYALMDNDIPFRKENIIISKLREEDGEAIVRQVLSLPSLPDAIFVSNDVCAASCINQFKKAGIHIPEDIAIVGFNNDITSRLIEPNLTTINYPANEIGQIAMKTIINNIDKRENILLNSSNKIILRANLIIRESSVKKK